MAVHAAVKVAAELSKSESGRKLLLVGAIACVAALVAVIAVPAGIAFAVFAGVQAGHSRTGGVCSIGGAQPAVDGYNSSQVGIAATIVAVGRGEGISEHGIQIALAVAIAESSLQNLDHGDAVDNTTIGVFQQGESYGPRADRMNVEKAAAAFFARMVKIIGWEAMDPGEVGHAVEIGPPAATYNAKWADAGRLLASFPATGASCAIPQDAAAAAKQLVAAMDAGRLVFLDQPSPYAKQVRDMAAGTGAAECATDARILGAILLALNNFKQVGISDLNRRCTGSLDGAGQASMHWQGKAVDFYSLDGRALTGDDANSIRLIQLLDPVLPPGSGIGQEQCRGGRMPGLRNITAQFPDSCTHQHVQVS